MTVDDPQARRTVMDLVKNGCNERIYPVGRLDRNTTGVLLFINDAGLASKLTHPKFPKKRSIMYRQIRMLLKWYGSDSSGIQLVKRCKKFTQIQLNIQMR